MIEEHAICNIRIGNSACQQIIRDYGEYPVLTTVQIYNYICFGLQRVKSRSV